MSKLDELIANPRNKPTAPPVAGRRSAVRPPAGRQAAAGEVGDIRAALEQLRAPQRPTGASQGALPPVDLSILSGTSAGAEKDGPSTLSQIGGGIAGALGKVIDVIDTPRAAVVSGMKELGDFVDTLNSKGAGKDSWYTGEDNKASWSDFKDQMWRNMGFGEIIANTGLSTGNSGADKALGFVGDLAVDPTMYVGLGVATRGAKAAGVGGEVALEQAVRGGSRTQIAKQLSKEGASDRLVAAAAERGRGALTKRGLARAGVDAEEAARFGSVIKGYQVGSRSTRGVTLPGTRSLVSAAEDAKGAVKQVLGRTAAAKTMRKLRVATATGERAALDVMRSKGTTVAQKAQAAKLLSVVNESRGVPAKFVQHSSNMLKKDLGKDLRHLSKEDAVLLTHTLEAGGASDVAAKVRKWFDDQAQALNDMGVPVQTRENYVPHRLTEDFRALARENPEVATYVERLTTREALQMERQLVAGEQFLGQVTDGTISDINRIAQETFGVKALKDDVRELIGDYLSEAGDAFGRSVQQRKLAEAGLTKEIGSKSTPLVASTEELAPVRKSLKKQLEKEAELADKAATTRRGALKKTRNLLDEQIAATRTRLDDIQRQLSDQSLVTESAVAKVARFEAEVATRQAEVDAWKKVAGSARRTERKALNRKIAQAEAEIVAKRAEIATVKDSIKAGQIKMDQLAKALKPAVEESGQLAAKKSELEAALQNVSGPIPNAASPLTEEMRLAKEMRRHEAAAARLARGQSELDVATLSEGLLRMRLTDLTESITKELEKLQSARGLTTNLPSGGKLPATRLQARDALRDRMSTVQAVLRDVNDPAVEMIGRLEAQAAIYDMRAWKQKTTVASLQKQIAAMETPGFREHIAQVFEDGFKAISETAQVPAWIDEALTVTKQVRDPQWWDKYMDFYKSSLNWWKAWAVASPGFVARNLQGGMFNMYIDGVAVQSGVDFSKFYKLFESDPENYMQKAIAKFGPEKAQRMEDALTATAATGWGQAPQEVRTALVETAASWNPLRADNKITRPVRKVSEHAEAWMRGTHAYDVLSRGGTIDQAADRVNMFHFNYRDITDFDRNAKLVSPFWTFYSRNMALQSQVWTRYPQKLNRSYFNLKRNMEYGQEEEVTPDWMVEGGAIRTPFKAGQDSVYWMPDIPSLRFAGDVDALGSGPSGLVSSMAPVPKLAAELMMGKQTFSGAPFKDSFQQASYDEFGNRQEGPREAPWWAQLPGIQQGLQAVGGMETYADGTPVMTDRVQYAIENMAPPLARLNALLPNQANKQQTHGTSIASFFGAGVRQLTPQMQESELWRRRQAIAEEQRRLEELGYGG